MINMEIYANERGNSYGCMYFISLCEEELGCGKITFLLITRKR